MKKAHIEEMDFEETPSVLQNFIKEQAEKEQKVVDDFITDSLWLFIKLPKIIIKRLYTMKIKYSIWGNKPKRYELENRITKRKFTLVIEPATFNFNQK